MFLPPSFSISSTPLFLIIFVFIVSSCVPLHPPHFCTLFLITYSVRLILNSLSLFFVLFSLPYLTFPLVFSSVVALHHSSSLSPLCPLLSPSSSSSLFFFLALSSLPHIPICFLPSRVPGSNTAQNPLNHTLAFSQQSRPQHTITIQPPASLHACPHLVCVVTLVGDEVAFMPVVGLLRLSLLVLRAG